MKENLLAATARRFFLFSPFPSLRPHLFVTAVDMGEDWEKSSNFALWLIIGTHIANIICASRA